MTGIQGFPSYFFSTFGQAVLYGSYLVSFAHSLRWVLYEDEGWKLRPRKRVNLPILTISILVFVLSTMDIVVVISILRTFDDPNEVTLVAKDFMAASVAVENLTLIMIDAVLIYRCWLVYEKSWRVICLPLGSWLANITTLTVFMVYYSMTLFSDAASLRTLALAALQVFYACNFVTNLYATSAIVYRIWSIARANICPSSILYNLGRVVTGTGILYTSTSLALVLTAVGVERNQFAYLLCDSINFSMAGITFNLLLIRIGQLRANHELDVVQSTPADSSANVVLSTVQFQFSSTTSENHSLASGSSDVSLELTGAAKRK